MKSFKIKTNKKTIYIYIYILYFAESHAELIDRFEDFEEMFRDFCTDENRGEENLIKKYEREILLAKKKANIKTIYTA